jgi:N-acetylneuraminic acid mutarotase
VVRSAGVWFAPNGHFYSMGGRVSDTAGTDIMNPYEYDPVAATWTLKVAAFPDNQNNNMVGAVLTEAGTPYIFCVGGSAAGAATSSTAVRRYDPATDTMIVETSDPWSGAPANTLPGGGAVFGNRLYVFGGFTINTAMTSQIWEFDPNAAAGTKWTLKTGVLPAQIGYVPCATNGGEIYIGGGSSWNGTTLVDSTTSCRYDPVQDQVVAIATIPRATGETKGVNEGGQLWVLGGGRTTPNPSNEVDAYDPVTDTWSLAPSFTSARRNFAADTDPATGKIYIVGGYVPSAPSSSMEIFSGPPTITSYCFGDGTGNPCPCGSPAGSPGHGCSNSAHPGGAIISVLSGSASINAADLRFRSVDHRLSTLGVWFQGDVLATQPAYGDGLRCVGSPLVRLYVVQPNVDPLDTPSSPSIVVQGGITTPGTIKGYFLAYRDPASYGCPAPATYNASNALNVTWGP